MQKIPYSDKQDFGPVHPTSSYVASNQPSSLSYASVFKQGKAPVLRDQYASPAPSEYLPTDASSYSFPLVQYPPSQATQYYTTNTESESIVAPTAYAGLVSESVGSRSKRPSASSSPVSIAGSWSPGRNSYTHSRATGNYLMTSNSTGYYESSQQSDQYSSEEVSEYIPASSRSSVNNYSPSEATAKRRMYYNMKTSTYDVLTQREAQQGVASGALILSKDLPKEPPTTPPKSGKNSTGKTRRSRGGCLTCRQRKKRCCETKPVCAECKSLSIRCRWPVPGTERKNRSKNHQFPKDEINHEVYGVIKILRGVVDYKVEETD